MKFINMVFHDSKDTVLSILSDNEAVNKNVRFKEGNGIPIMKIKEKSKGKIRITCEMLGRATRDNSFIVGTYFTGKLTEENGVTKLRGVILTAPIYHIALIAMLVAFLWKCVDLKGISVVPIFLVLFDIIMFKDEFKKQGYISRYISRAARRTSGK